MSAEEQGKDRRHAVLTIIDYAEDEDASISAEFSQDEPSTHAPLYLSTLHRLNEDGEVALWGAVPAAAETSAGPAVPPNEGHPEEGRVPRFEVNLDEPVERRWNAVIDHFRERLRESDRIISQFLRDAVGKIKGAFLESVASGMMRTYNAFGGVYYGAELAAISARCGIALGRLIMIQLVYEVSAACTSTVAPFHGVPLLARNMDWELPGLDLRALTVQLDFTKGGRLCFRAASWAGCVGIFTGCKPGPGGFAVSVNFRLAGGTVWQNIKNGLGRGWPVSFLVRETLESAPDYRTAEAWLSNSPVMYVLTSLF
ncbi:MAG: acid ceramidase family protein [archaeon]|nr:acid ceramidase family protein [archaeon]